MLAQIEQSFAVREASEERMRQFVADASHELRTPLATVRGYAELYRQGAVREPADVASAMGRIEGEADRMSGLVEDLLHAGPARRPPADADQPRSTSPCSPRTPSQDARARGPAPPHLPARASTGQLEPTVVPGDEAKLRQVVANLVATPSTTPPPARPVEIARRRASWRRPAVLEVRDHGPGIDPESARRVFERFYRADPSRARGTGGGNGLGLAIVAAIVGAHRGRVGVAQTPGGGATFVVELPTGNSQEPSRPL